MATKAKTATAKAEAPTVTFKREDAPVAKRGRKSVWAQRLAPLMETPNAQYRILGITFKNAAAASRVAHGLKTGKLSVPESPGTWEFVSRTVDGEPALYATYFAPKK